MKRGEREGFVGIYRGRRRCPRPSYFQPSLRKKKRYVQACAGMGEKKAEQQKEREGPHKKEIHELLIAAKKKSFSRRRKRGLEV